MALIPEETPKQIALVVIVAALGLLYAMHAYWYTPRAMEIETLESQLTQLQDQNRAAEVTAARGGADLEERLAAYERHVARLEQLIPRGEEVPALLNSMAMEARQSGVELGSMRPEPAQTGEFYTRQTYEWAVIGDFHDVGRFLTAVASLPRIITPLDLEIERYGGTPPRQEMEAPILARFRVETYVLPGDLPPEDVELPEEVQG